MRDPQTTSAGQRDGVVIRRAGRNHDGSIFGRDHDGMVIVARGERIRSREEVGHAVAAPIGVALIRPRPSRARYPMSSQSRSITCSKPRSRHSMARLSASFLIWDFLVMSGRLTARIDQPWRVVRTGTPGRSFIL